MNGKTTKGQSFNITYSKKFLCIVGTYLGWTY